MNQVRRTNLHTDLHTDIPLDQAVTELACVLPAELYPSRMSILTKLARAEPIETATHRYHWPRPQ
jgi:hypothetical protein